MIRCLIAAPAGKGICSSLGIRLIAFLLWPCVVCGQTTGLPSPSLTPTTSPTVSGSTYYVDNVLGSDSNNGTGPATPWKTIAHVNAATIASGSQVLFLSTDVWHEQITVQSAGITYGAYGPQRTCSLSSKLAASCTNMPIIDGADVITGWTLVTGTTYSSSYTSTASKGFVDSLYAQTAPLTLETSLANVESTPGSIYSNGTLVYVNLLDGSSPANHTIEVSGARKYGISIGLNNTITVTGLEFVRQAKSGIYLGNNAVNTVTTYTISNNVLFNIGDSLGDSIPFSGANNSEGAIFFYDYSPAIAGLSITGNWVGEMDFTDSALSDTQAGIQISAPSSGIIMGNKVATVHGAAMQIADSYDASCSGTTISNNEMTNSEEHLRIKGCSSLLITNNQMHDGKGNGIEIGGGNQTSDQTNSGIVLAYNVIHNITPGYSNGIYNGIDINYAQNGFATGNQVWAVASQNMTLEGSTGTSTSSTGWTVTGNSFDTTNDTQYNGTACTTYAGCIPMYVYEYSLSGGLTMRANTFVVNALDPYIIYNASSGSDTAHYYTQPQFDAICIDCEIPGTYPASYGQATASSTGGTCSMSAGTSCTITLGHTYTTPVCIVTQQSATLTGGAAGCTVSGTTTTITAATANSETWGAFVFGNPN